MNRNLIYEKINALSDKNILSEKICTFLKTVQQYKEAKTIFCYLPLSHEVNTYFICEDILKSNKTLGLPVVSSENMEFFAYTDKTPLEKGKYGILEPSGSILLTDCEVVIVPMVAYDKKGNRMGHGKGYYDKYLAKKNAYKIGVAFSCQEAEILPKSTDIPMDMVITENGIILFR